MLAPQIKLVAAGWLSAESCFKVNASEPEFKAR